MGAVASGNSTLFSGGADIPRAASVRSEGIVEAQPGKEIHSTLATSSESAVSHAPNEWSSQDQPSEKESLGIVYNLDGLQAAAYSAWSPLRISHHKDIGAECERLETCQYGSVAPSFRKPGNTTRLRNAGKQALESNFFSTVFTFVFPPFAFAVVVPPLVFNMHLNHPYIVWAPFVVALAISLEVLQKPQRVGEFLHNNRDASWRRLSGTLSLFATVTAGITGEVLWRHYMQPFYALMAMMTYDGIDPRQATGTRFMDAGIVHFTPDTRLYPSMGMSFTSWNTYCVAPLLPLSNTTSTGSYDFWAVGLDCCSPGDTAFRCGEWQNHNVHGGLRHVGEEEAAYYRLAVQQAEAAYGITASSPLFFYWLQDPQREHERLFSKGFRAWILCNVAHFFVNTLAIISHAVSWSVESPGP